MRKHIAFVILFFGLLVNAQTEREPVVWITSVSKISDTEYDIIFEGKILKDWHVYSQYNPEGGAIPLAISTKDSTQVIIKGKAKESKTYREYSDVWEQDEIFFKDKATLTQRIQLTNKEIDLLLQEILLAFIHKPQLIFY